MKFKTQPRGAKGNCKVKLLTGRTVWITHNGPLPQYLQVNVPPPKDEIGGRGASIWCRRCDVEAYRQMTVKEMRAAKLMPADPFMGDDPQSTK